MGVLLAAWLPVALLLWRRRSELAGPPGRHARRLAVVGAVGLAVTIALDLNPWWLVGVALLVAAQLIAVGSVSSGARSGTG